MVRYPPPVASEPTDGDDLARTATAPISSTARSELAYSLGASLGRYRLERELGTGGMGVVHAAFDPDLERRIALKVLRVAAPGLEAKDRLLREARAMARLAHPNVVTVHEVGTANGHDYVAMELIQGETLADWLRVERRRPAEITAAFLAAIRDRDPKVKAFMHVDPAAVEARLAEDAGGTIKAVMVVHNETSTGVTTRIPAVRQAIDRARHAALLMVDTISALGSLDYRHAEWGVDVSVACSQKGLMLPPGLGLNAVSDKALAAAKQGGMPRSYWDWEEMLKSNTSGYFPYTPATNLLFGLREALAMFREQGMPAVFARHARHAEATRRAVRAWGLEILCAEPAEYSNVLTAVMMPPGHDAEVFRAAVLARFDMSLGVGLGRLAGKVFRIGHVGDFNDLTLIGTLGGVEMGLAISGVPHRAGGTQAAMTFLSGDAPL
jgi:aspartate aminotransferase-like enzyme